MAVPLAASMLSPNDRYAESMAFDTGPDASWPLMAYPLGRPFAKWVGEVPMALVALSCGHSAAPVAAYCPFCGAKVVSAAAANEVVYNGGCCNPSDYSACLVAAEERDGLESGRLAATGWYGPGGGDSEHMEVVGRPLRAHARLHVFEDAEGEGMACIALPDASRGWLEAARFPRADADVEANYFNGAGWLRWAADERPSAGAAQAGPAEG